jgi:hypothetical protein
LVSLKTTKGICKEHLKETVVTDLEMKIEALKTHEQGPEAARDLDMKSSDRKVRALAQEAYTRVRGEAHHRCILHLTQGVPLPAWTLPQGSLETAQRLVKSHTWDWAHTNEKILATAVAKALECGANPEFTLYEFVFYSVWCFRPEIGQASLRQVPRPPHALAEFLEQEPGEAFPVELWGTPIGDIPRPINRTLSPAHYGISIGSPDLEGGVRGLVLFHPDGTVLYEHGDIKGRIPRRRNLLVKVPLLAPLSIKTWAEEDDDRIGFTEQTRAIIRRLRETGQYTTGGF